MKIYDEIENLEKKIADKNNTSDFSPKVYDSGWRLQKQAIALCNILAKVKAPKSREYRLRMAKVLAEISRML